MDKPTINRAQTFFDTHVRPTVNAWRDSPTDLRLAMHAAVALNQMADHFWHEFADTEPHRVFRQTTVSRFRREIVSRYPVFGLIRDVADAHKHVKLDRDDRVLTSAGQTNVGSLGWGEAEFGVGVYGGAPEIIVELDSGTKRHFSAVVAEVESMWQGLLSTVNN
jgi:hypothetical protein